MKTSRSILIFCALVFTSCSNLKYFNVYVIDPPAINLPPQVKSVGLINRSVNHDSRISINGLHDELLRSSRFSEVKMLSSDRYSASFGSEYPAALPWNIVEKICYENQVDAIVELSFYDTESKVDVDEREIKSKDTSKKEIKIEYTTYLKTNIATGWRVYNPINRLLSDDYNIKEYVSSSASGRHPLKAMEAFVEREKEVKEASSKCGHKFAKRIIPRKERESRSYFINGSPSFEIAARKAEVEDWAGAAEIWRDEISNPDPLIAGRACYNLALANEMLGDYNAAVHLASKSYSDFNISEALDYLNVLKYRIEAKRILEGEIIQ